MEQEYKPNLKPKKATSMEECLKRIDISQLKKGLSKSKTHGKSLSTIGLVTVRQRKTGSQHGEIGYAALSNGETIDHEIQVAVTGLPEIPQLKGREWLLIDTKIQREIYDNHTPITLSIEQEKLWMPVLIQMQAATQTPPYELLITRLTRLKSIRGTQNMTTEQASVFLEDIAEMIIEDGFCYEAIDLGIKALLRGEKNNWFPDYSTLMAYIYKIDYQIKRRKAKLHEILSRPHRIEGNAK